jgi:hypothetical protein
MPTASFITFTPIKQQAGFAPSLIMCLFRRLQGCTGCSKPRTPCSPTEASHKPVDPQCQWPGLSDNKRRSARPGRSLCLEWAVPVRKPRALAAMPALALDPVLKTGLQIHSKSQKKVAFSHSLQSPS